MISKITLWFGSSLRHCQFIVWQHTRACKRLWAHCGTVLATTVAIGRNDKVQKRGRWCSMCRESRSQSAVRAEPSSSSSMRPWSTLRWSDRFRIGCRSRHEHMNHGQEQGRRVQAGKIVYILTTRGNLEHLRQTACGMAEPPPLSRLTGSHHTHKGGFCQSCQGCIPP